MNEATKKFLADIDSLLENAPAGIDIGVLEHLMEARESIVESGSEDVSPGQQAANEAAGKDAEEDAAEGEMDDVSPGKKAAMEVAAQDQS